MDSGEQLKKKILRDMKVELADEFDKNFERKAFFSEKWKPRAREYPKGSLLMVTGTMRRSIRAEIQDNGIRFSSAVPYAAIHNEGGSGTKMVKQHVRTSKKGRQYTVRAHTRKFTMPKRQFVGDGEHTQLLIRKVIDSNLKKYDQQITDFFKQ